MKHNFKELKIWKMAMSLTKEIYLVTKSFPKEEIYGLTNQIRRSAVSVPSNIAEGCGRNTDKQLAHFLNISMGSLCELETQIIISTELEYLDQERSIEILKNIDEIERMTNGFRSKIETSL